MYPHGGFPAARLELTTAELIAAGSDRFTDTWTEMDHAPVLTANVHGKGMALLLNALERRTGHRRRQVHHPRRCRQAAQVRRTYKQLQIIEAQHYQNSVETALCFSRFYDGGK
jgi:hypothetical protein